MRRARSGGPQFVAVIADIVGSRELTATRRRAIQRTLVEELRQLNERHANVFQAMLKITSGDEFEGLLHARDAAAAIPELIWTLDERFDEPALRMGFGLGAVDTDLSDDAASLDGPAFHHARAAVALAAKKKLLGGVFAGFGAEHDGILNGLARLLRHQRSRWSEQQTKVAARLRSGMLQSEAALQLGLTKQAVSAYARAAGWEAYAEGEAALRVELEQALRAHLEPAPHAGIPGVPAGTPSQERYNSASSSKRRL